MPLRRSEPDRRFSRLRKLHQLRSQIAAAYFANNWSFWLVFSRILRSMRRCIRLCQPHLDSITTDRVNACVCRLPLEHNSLRRNHRVFSKRIVVSFLGVLSEYQRISLKLIPKWSKTRRGDQFPRCGGQFQRYPLITGCRQFDVSGSYRDDGLQSENIF